MIKKASRNELRKRRHRRSRKTLAGTPERPRLAIFRSNRHLYAQVIDDTRGHTLVAASTLEEGLRGKEASDMELAREVGERVAERALQSGIQAVVLDRGGYKYHGKVAALAEGARSKGLAF
jgi:large subunit ribosomal protein L18